MKIFIGCLGREYNGACWNAKCGEARDVGHRQKSQAKNYDCTIHYVLLEADYAAGGDLLEWI